MAMLNEQTETPLGVCFSSGSAVRRPTKIALFSTITPPYFAMIMERRTPSVIL